MAEEEDSLSYDFDKRYYSVHQLYPDNDLSTPKNDHKLTLIFFHSPFDDHLAWENTWIQREHPEVCWPRDWLPKPPGDRGLGTDIRVLSVAYPVPRKSMKEWVKHMMELLICSSTWQLQHPHNIILVGHKFGGILIKSLIIKVNKVARRKICQDVAEKEAKDSCEAFQHNLSGIMFYSVPHFMTTRDIGIMFQGDNYVEIRDSSVPADSSQNICHKLSALQALSHQIEAINEDFEYSIANDHTKICVISNGLTKKMKASTHNQQKMKLPASDPVHIIEDADDGEVCKPINNLHASYTILLDFVHMVCKQKALPVIPTANAISDCVAFSYQVLCDATKNFDPAISKIGEGSFGIVFKAIINHQGHDREVAIKRLSYDGFHTAAMNEEFRQEIWRVSTVRHKNIVSLLGYCLPEVQCKSIVSFLGYRPPEANSPLLMVTPLHSSLFKHLYEGEKPWLNWQARFKIAMGVAEGLAYLHDGAPERLIHCDIKTGNILFDPDTFQPYIADFGTARFMQRSESMVGTSTLTGTPGFMDPHFQRYMRRSVMVDVYSFGVLLFVLVSGKQDVVHLLELAKDEDVVDEEFIHQGDSSYNDLEIHRVLAVARQCTKFEPLDRPTMSKVTMMLNGDHPSESLSSFVVHKNIISPLGYNTKQVDFLSQMPTLRYLYLSERLSQLNWEQRLNIAIGVAEALAYLHDNAPQCVVHGNINSGCIVFDPNTSQAYITEFEFARFMQRSESKIQVSTSTGSQGYIDPHFQRYLQLSTKVDVYSFGVLLFVLVSGKQDVVHLLELAKDEDVVDEEFIHQGDSSYIDLEIHRVLAVARQCTKFEPLDRPTMSKVAMMLNGDHPSESLSLFVVHKNIISPFGYNTKQVDFLSQMATPTYLNLSEELRQLNWEQRLNIAIGVAEALAYLHDNAPQCVVHGNINSGCIVFDPNTSQAYITEFEFARLMQRSESKIQVSTSTGRQGYIDPHFQMYLQLSTKVDVYSFGVLLCVLVSNEQDIVHLVDRAKTRDVMDVDFFKHDRTYKAHEARRVLAIARKCIKFEPTKRPPMSRIVTMLRNIHLSSFQLALLKLLPS